MSRASSSPGALRCLVAVTCADVALRLFGVRSAIVLARRLAGRRFGGSVDAAEPIAICLARAAAFYPRRARCLEQSLALFVLVRRAGVPAELRFGVRPYPFLAHTWVEVDGAPLNEPADTIRQLAPFREVSA
jgi:hypothetical protein